MHNDADSAAQGAQIDAFEILSVIVYGTLLRMLKAEQQAHEGRLPAACLADYRYILPRAYFEREIVDDERHIFGISERNIAHFYSAREARQHLLAVRNLRNGVKNGCTIVSIGFICAIFSAIPARAPKAPETIPYAVLKA